MFATAPIVALLLPTLLLSGAEETGAIRDRARAVIERGRYEDRLDLDPEDGESRSGKARGNRGESRWARDGDGDGDGFKLPNLDMTPFAVVFEVLAYGLAAAALAIVGVAIVRAILNRRRGGGLSSTRAARPVAAVARSNPIPAAVAEAQGDALALADRLAAGGRFGEAVHQLLLGALASLSRISQAVRDRSHTSREIERSLELAEDPRQALAELIRAVEIFVFGGRELTAAAFDRCRRSFERIREAAPS